MMPRLLLFSLLFFVTYTLYAQSTPTVTGVLYDEDQQPLPVATVVLFSLEDSTVVDYTLSSDKGAFSLKGKQDKSYQLQVSYLGYEPLFHTLTLTQNIVLDTLQLRPAVATLETAVIEAEHIPIRMNGDTLEFNSAAFSVEQHDKVEDLLLQLPGVELDEDGTIRVNGKKVEKVTVDGKDFFGDNAQVVLKSLPADAIEKVQAFDKKTDKEELLGKAASGDNKQLNLTLKEDKKVGYMGDVRGGYGYSPRDGHRYEGMLNLHHFNPKMRLSLIGGINNINESGFDYQTISKMTGGFSRFITSNSNLRLSYAETNRDIPNTWSLVTGLNRTLTAGTNINWFLSPKTDLSMHYLYTNLLRDRQTIINRRSITVDNFFANERDQQNAYFGQGHQANVKFKQTIDSTQTINGRVRLRHDLKNNEAKTQSLSYNALGELTNGLNQTIVTQQQSMAVEGNVRYSKKLQKKGRAFWINGYLAQHTEDEQRTNKSQTRFYNNGQLSGTDTLLQDQEQLESNQIYLLEVGYAEPLGEKTSWEWQGVGAWSNGQVQQNTYDRLDGALVLNPLLTDGYNKWYNYQALTTGIEHKWGTKKKSFEANIGVQRTQLQGAIQSSEQRINQQYIYPVGQVQFSLQTKMTSSIRLGYSGSIQEPRLEQLQPLLNNTNPLFLNLGNPNLIPSYRHNVNLSWTDFNAGNFQMLSIFYNVSTDNIISKQTIDEQLQTVSTFVNFGTGHSLNAYARYSSRIRKFLKWTASLNGGVNQNPALINDAVYDQWNTNGAGTLKLENSKKRSVDVSLRLRIRASQVNTVQNSSLNTFTLSHDYQLRAKVRPGKGWTFQTKFQFWVYEPVGFDERVFLPIWSASISKTLLKSKALVLTLRADNLLDQQFQVQRNSFNGNLTETHTNLLGRFFMLSVGYKLDKMGGKKVNSRPDFFIFED